MKKIFSGKKNPKLYKLEESKKQKGKNQKDTIPKLKHNSIKNHHLSTKNLLTFSKNPKLIKFRRTQIVQQTKKVTNLQLEYRNLLAACLGNKDSKKKPNHCDASKGNEELLFLKNPASNDFLDVFDYQILPASKEVRIVPSAPYKDNNDLRRDIDKILNLNEQSLRSRRFTVWQRAMEKICCPSFFL